LLLSVDRLTVSVASGLAGGKGSITDVNVATVQIDDQSPNTAAPVLLWHSSVDGEPLLHYTMSELAASNSRDGKVRWHAVALICIPDRSFHGIIDSVSESALACES
jgi:hypothetical protein